MQTLRSLCRGGARAAQQQHRNTTILCVRKDDKVVIMGDGQITIGDKAVVKGTANKLRRINDNVLVGFAGSTADAMTLLDKLEAKITEFPGQLLRACVELAKEWRGDKHMRQLDAALIVANTQETLEIDGTGNVIAPEGDGVLAIGSGGLYAKSAARALVDIDGLDAEHICRKSMDIATSIDIFSNNQYQVELLDKSAEPADEANKKKAEQDKDALKVQPIIKSLETETATEKETETKPEAETETKPEEGKKKPGKGGSKPKASSA
eukprot:TRINITY_DN4598_c0_g1_i1.p1 TRINITY_DN4598_c0_g1~~TRINITY_DN4598_c0_g1_i1.p1  ORF type:complete len:283 (+),score=74.01 TRINITY_DN4598_c0_g1_i1:53-850(+)